MIPDFLPAQSRATGTFAAGSGKPPLNFPAWPPRRCPRLSLVRSYRQDPSTLRQQPFHRAGQRQVDDLRPGSSPRFLWESGGTIKLVVATVEPKLSLPWTPRRPMHMPDSSAKVLLSPATRYLSTLLFVANAADDAQPTQKICHYFSKISQALALPQSVLWSPNWLTALNLLLCLGAKLSHCV